MTISFDQTMTMIIEDVTNVDLAQTPPDTKYTFGVASSSPTPTSSPVASVAPSPTPSPAVTPTPSPASSPVNTPTPSPSPESKPGKGNNKKN